ncbi:MAG: CHC2 zinc finger domain-containing protein, partial [Anaerovoracaceae bacterium]
MSNNVVENVKTKCDIVDVISKVVPLKSSGSSTKGLCP